MLKDLIAKMGDPKKVTVGLSVTPNVGLEMIQIDPETRTVVKYGYKSLDYNFSTREIADYDAFKDATMQLFAELALSPHSCNVVVNLTNVHFGLTDLSLLLPDEAITQAVISECERSYIFKRVDPNVSWTRLPKKENTETQNIAYVGLQANAIDELVGALTSIGCQVVAIENSVASLIKSIHYAQIAPELYEENTTWNLVVIGANNYSVA
jgi:Tfp pilus assembly PilM family ATPase